MAGQAGSRLWTIWTHRYYGDPKSSTSGNTLYILRLVIEDDLDGMRRTLDIGGSGVLEKLDVSCPDSEDSLKSSGHRPGQDAHMSSKDNQETPHTPKLQQAIANLKAVLQAAQAEAAEWKLSSVKFWDPPSLVRALVEQTGIQYGKVDREDESIASLC